MFENEITSLGYTYSLVRFYKTPRGFLEAEYYCPISPYSQYVYITGPFVSESI